MLRALSLLPMLAACASIEAPGAADTAALGETIRLGAVEVTPRSVIEDSRCPTDATCVWVGRAVLRAEVDDGARRTRDLILGEPIPAGGGTLTLSAVLPARRADAPIAPADYRFRLAFTRREQSHPPRA